MLHSTFNTARNHQTNVKILDEIDHKPTAQWALFSKEKLKQVIAKCNDSLAPGPDKLSWRHLKIIIKQDKCLTNIINIANMCINLEHWLDYFKHSSTIIIPKPNKPSYNHAKIFCPIVLLNTLGKLIEKVIAKRIQFTVTKNNFIHPCQLGGLKFKSTMDTGVALMHIVRSRWAKGKSISTLAFDISQFFLFLNHNLLTTVLSKVGLEPKVSKFFVDYVVKRKTNYV